MTRAFCLAVVALALVASFVTAQTLPSNALGLPSAKQFFATGPVSPNEPTPAFYALSTAGKDVQARERIQLAVVKNDERVVAYYVKRDLLDTAKPPLAENPNGYSRYFGPVYVAGVVTDVAKDQAPTEVGVRMKFTFFAVDMNGKVVDSSLLYHTVEASACALPPEPPDVGSVQETPTAVVLVIWSAETREFVQWKVMNYRPTKQ